MWCGSVTLRVKGKEVPRDVTRMRSRMTQDEVKSGVNLKTQTGKEREGNKEMDRGRWREKEEIKKGRRYNYKDILHKDVKEEER